MYSPNRRNQYDRRDSLELGDKARDAFSKLADTRGWKLTEATSEQDIDEDWDYLMARDIDKYRVDVKAMKRIGRGDPDVQDEWVWVELHGVRPRDRGGLYDGKADLIGCEKRASFVIVKRSDLIALVEALVDLEVVVSSGREAKYKVYRRLGRPDKITLVETEKLDTIKWDEWVK